MKYRVLLPHSDFIPCHECPPHSSAPSHTLCTYFPISTGPAAWAKFASPYPVLPSCHPLLVSRVRLARTAQVCTYVGSAGIISSRKLLGFGKALAWRGNARTPISLKLDNSHSIYNRPCLVRPYFANRRVASQNMVEPNRASILWTDIPDSPRSRHVLASESMYSI